MNAPPMPMTEDDIRARLVSMRDPVFHDFQTLLMPTIDPDTVLGVRTPKLRTFARELGRMPESAEAFMRRLPHRYYEENNLHGFLIEQISDYNACIVALNIFLPYVDNWATCDMLRPKVFTQNLPQLEAQCRLWIADTHPYTVRYGIETLLCFFLGDSFRPEQATLVAGVQSEEYYVRMMVAWYFATALAKQYSAVLPFLEQHTLEPWTHNKAIQKAIESRSITAAQKRYLRTLKQPTATAVSAAERHNKGETTMLFIEYPKCSTCQKARQWLDTHGISYTDRNICTQNPTYEELTQWHAACQLPLKRFFNTSGLAYKALGLKDKLPTMSEDEQLRLLASDGMLVKRPIIVNNNTILTGFRENEWLAALTGETE